MNHEEQLAKRKKKFQDTKGMICSNGNRGHDWMPIAWNISPASKHVATIMCGCCFCQISINDGYEFGAKPKDL